jgi:uncharacterized membrane protein
VIEGGTKMSKIEKLCENIDEIEEVHSLIDRLGRRYNIINYIQTSSKLTIPNNIYIEVLATAVKGTIGRVVDIDFKITVKTDNHGKKIMVLNEYGSKFIYEVDGRKKTSTIPFHHSKILTNHNGTTKWVRNVKKKPKVRNPINKFKQELQQGDWVIGVGSGAAADKPLQIGRVTRWTDINVWASMNYDAPKNEREEFRFSSIKQTFLLPSNDYHIDALMIAIVKGWNGR